MDAITEPDNITLCQAMMRWTDQRLVAKVRQYEARHTLYEMAAVTHRPRFCNDEELSQPSNNEWMGGPPDYTLLIDAHKELERDFRGRVVRGDFYLQGVLTKPELTTEHRNIPGAWVADGGLDFVANGFSIAKQRYAAVIASRQPLQPNRAPDALANDPPNTPCDGRQLPPITELNIRSLTDDEVLLLLEDHARRVVEGPDARLIAPGKLSVMPIIRRKMLESVFEKRCVAT